MTMYRIVTCLLLAGCALPGGTSGTPRQLQPVLQPVASLADVDSVYDVVIRHGRVLDGSGNPWILADVAISNGRFVRVGRVTGRGRREIDATGKYVSPGWIDMMDQSGSVLPRGGLAENKLRMGVTKLVPLHKPTRCRW